MSSTVTRILILSTILASFVTHAPAGTTLTTKKASTPSKRPSRSAKSKAHSRRPKKVSWKKHGQQEIQPERASAIQEALIREKYLTGEPNGQWDARTQAAMARYQDDHGWQSKVTPDSRALIKLGLGPDYSEKNMMLLAPKPTAGTVTASGTASDPTTPK